MDGSMLMHHNEKEAVGSPDDILARRLKNRERQRRYRARKRHEADLRKATQSTPLLHYQQMPTELVSVPVEVDISANATSPDCLTRVRCQRDWKKDARSAHIQKKNETGACIISSVECGGPADVLMNHSNIPIKDDNATRGLQSSRRHWKVEARNKRSLE